MKIDFDLLDQMAAAGASAQSIIVLLRAQDARKAPKRTKDRTRARAKASETARNGAKVGETEREQAKPLDQARARLFGLVARIVVLGLPESRARSVLGQWAKITHDNVEAIEAAIGEAERKRPADPIGFIRACLQERSTINGHRPRTVSDAGNDLIARAEAAERGDDSRTIDAEFHRVEGG